MAVLQMQRMSICALKKDRKAILEKIQSMGVMEINHVLDEDEDFRRMDTANARSSFEKAANSADRALEILNEYAPVKTSMLSSLEGKKLVDAKVHEEVIRKREELLKVVSQIQALDKEKAENKAEILKLENRIESLVPWLSLDIPMNATGTKKTSVILGSIPGLADISGIYEILADAAPEVEAADAYVISSGQDMTCIAVICLKQEEQSIEEALRSRGFSRIAQSSAKTIPWDIGLLAGGVGSALSDLLTGYPQWVLPTLIIKGIMGYAGSKITHAGKTPARMLSARTFIGALVSIVIMIAGYTIAGGIMYGSVATGLAQVPGLTTEGIIGIIGFYILGFVMEKCHVSKFISEGV